MRVDAWARAQAAEIPPTEATEAAAGVAEAETPLDVTETPETTTTDGGKA